MKQSILYLAAVLLSMSSCQNGTLNKTSEIKVWGNCNMCKKTIEGSLDVDGVLEADWNKDTKMMSIGYDSTLIDLEHIEQLISKSGYDTEMFRAEDNTYNNLHDCCKYERKEE